MREISSLGGIVLRLAAAASAALLLAGCMILSEAPLVGDEEGAEVLPATAYLFGYEDKDGGFVRGDDPPFAMTLSGGTYSTADNSMNARFVPLGEPDKYLLALVNPDSNLYGVATLRDNILVAEVVLGDASPLDTVKTLLAGDPLLGNIAEEEGGLMVTSRAALDALIRLNREGKLPLAGLVMYVSDSPDAEPPARIVKEGDAWIAAE